MRSHPRTFLSLFWLFVTPVAFADMRDDSPVRFPKTGALSSKYPPDQPPMERVAPEPDYVIFNTPMRSLEQIKAIWRTMPKGRLKVDPTDWMHLERTRNLLTEGGDIHLLAMGDSIVNDSVRSGWDGLLQRAYPRARIKGTAYIRGGGGCQHFREEQRVARNVIPRKPDLVLLGGISQKDIESIREVIRQLREGLPEVEILLMTGAFGSADPRKPSELNHAPHSGTGQYGIDLRKLAGEERCAFLDMTTPWAEFLNSTGKHPHVYYRDAVHANERGEQILAGILVKYFHATSALK